MRNIRVALGSCHSLASLLQNLFGEKTDLLKTRVSNMKRGHEDMCAYKTRVMACRGWFLFTGETIHACSSRSAFKNYAPIQKRVVMIDGHSTNVVGIGTVELRMSTWCSLTLSGVAHVPSINKDIISSSKFLSEGYSILLESQDKWTMLRQGVALVPCGWNSCEWTS